jgi:hypothetical protein
MALPSFAVTSDAELVTAARDKTSYDDAADELPGDATTGQMSGIVDDAKRVLYMKTGSDQWYTDVAYGQALVAMTAMKMKEAVENINIEMYGVGDETLSFSNADPEDSQQIRSWSSEVNEGLNESGIEFDKAQDLSLKNTSSYIG